MSEVDIKEGVMGTAMLPLNMAEALQLANLMASAKLVPQALQQSPADCFMIIQQAIRWQMDIFAVAQECSVIQGRPMYSGKIVAAVINTRAGLKQRLSYEYKGQNGNRSVVVTGHIDGEKAPRAVEVFLAKVRTNNAQWDKQPDQQLAYHAARVWARRHVPELMLGVYSREEFDDQVSRPRVGPNVMRQPALTAIEPPHHDPQTGDVDDDGYADQIEHIIGNGTQVEQQNTGEGKPVLSDNTQTSQPVDAPATSGAAHPLDIPDELKRSADELTKVWLSRLETAAIHLGSDELQNIWNQASRTVKSSLKNDLDTRLKPMALETDARMEAEAAEEQS